MLVESPLPVMDTVVALVESPDIGPQLLTLITGSTRTVWDSVTTEESVKTSWTVLLVGEVGAVSVICVALIWRGVTLTPPMVTLDTRSRPLPVIVIVAPLFKTVGLMALTVTAVTVGVLTVPVLPPVLPVPPVVAVPVVALVVALVPAPVLELPSPPPPQEARTPVSSSAASRVTCLAKSCCGSVESIVLRMENSVISRLRRSCCFCGLGTP